MNGRLNRSSPGADMISTVEFSGSEGLDVFLPAAGGKWALAGDYVWSNGRLPYSQSGQWGYLRVLPSDGSTDSAVGRRDVVFQAGSVGCLQRRTADYSDCREISQILHFEGSGEPEPTRGFPVFFFILGDGILTFV